ncbi:MAG: type IX secretion system membrane protein PorP/SprF [Flavobacteriales bacterium]|nr:MAG: type IX secretion system membrane protein PorP/SprF [Flavobacteriales bacterium]
MKMRYILTLFGLCFVQFAMSQQTVNYSQYATAVTPINTAGSFLYKEAQVNVIGRYQWVDLEGAPTAYRLAASMPIGKTDLRIGLNIKHENISVEKLGEALAFVGKEVRLSATDYLALSVGAGVSYYNGNFSQLSSVDPMFSNDLKETEGMLSAGLMYYRPEKFYAGISLPRLTFSKIGLGSSSLNYDVSTLYHFTAGAVIPLGSDFDLKPATLLSYAKNLDFQADVSALFYLKKTFGLGANIKTEGEMAALASLLIKNVNIGFGYQFATSNSPLSRTFNNSTYEFSLAYRFGKGFGGLL